jgi:DNA segregation ATPase FtsK/SpoIIIE-like protein
MELHSERPTILIYQAAGVLGLLIASWGRLDPTVLTTEGKRLPHWAVNRSSEIVAIAAPDAWLKMAGVLIAGLGFGYSFRLSQEVERQEQAARHQLQHQRQLQAIQEQAAVQRQVLAAAEMLKIAQVVENLRAEEKGDEEIAAILGVPLSEIKSLNGGSSQAAVLPGQPSLDSVTVDTSEPRVPNPPDDPTVYGLLLATLKALHKARYSADYVTSFKGPSFIQFILEMRDAKKLQEAIDKGPAIIQAELHLPKLPMIDNEHGFLALSLARPDREFRKLSEQIEALPVPKRPALFLGVDLKEMHHFIELDGKGMEAVLLGGLPRVAGKTNLIRQMIGFAAKHYSYRHLQFLLFDGKGTELNDLKDSPYLVDWPGAASRQVGHSEEEADLQLQWVEQDLEHRRSLFAFQGVSNIEDYNALEGVQPEGYRVWILDESHIGFPDMRKETMVDAKTGEATQVKRLSDVMSVAATFGWLIVFCTQAPDRKTIHRQIDAKIGHRIGLLLQRDRDSELVIQAPGCERLLGKGDMLSRRGGEEPIRLQAYECTRGDLKEWCFPKLAKLTHEQQRDLIFELRSKGRSNAEIIRRVWQISEGDSGWAKAQQEFLALTLQNHPENLPP